MSAKTKIVVLHMKELIYTGIIIALGILLAILLLAMFRPDNNITDTHTSAPASSEDITGTSASSLYIPGIYTTELVLGGHTIDVEVIVEPDAITSVRLVNLNEAVTTMYPLLQPTLDTLCEQIYATQSLDGISYNNDSKYTSLVLLEAIQNSLDKATANTAD